MGTVKAISSFSALFITAALTAAPTLIRAQKGSGHLAYPVAVAYPAQPGYNQQGPGGWDAPPRGYTRDLQRSGFRDGLEGARKDLENRRRPDVNNRDEFRNYRGPERRAYRQAFQAGYRAFWNHQGGRGRY